MYSLFLRLANLHSHFVSKRMVPSIIAEMHMLLSTLLIDAETQVDTLLGNMPLQVENNLMVIFCLKMCDVYCTFRTLFPLERIFNFLICC